MEPFDKAHQYTCLYDTFASYLILRTDQSDLDFSCHVQEHTRVSELKDWYTEFIV